MKVLRADRYATVPWRNGGGTTREIAFYRDLKRHDDFLWRLSLATVDRSGPFSSFQGVDRTIALLAGNGMSLTTQAGRVDVTSTTEPFAFEGELPVECALLEGTTIDLNAMTRRDHFRHHMRRQHFTGWLKFVGGADNTYLVVNSPIELSWVGRTTLQPQDTIADIARGEAFEVYADQPAEVFIIELTDHAPWVIV